MIRLLKILLPCLTGLLLFSLAGCSKAASDKTPAAGTLDQYSVLNQDLPENRRKTVLVLHSYGPDFIWVQNLNKGIAKGLDEERFYDGRNTTINYFYMDTKRKASESWKKQISKEAIDTIRKMKPNVVIATDDNAQKYVVAKFLDSSIPFIFAGVNADPAKYGYIDSMEQPGHNVTGSIERERFQQSIRFLRRLKPGVKNIAVICDGSPTGQAVVGRVKNVAPSVGVTISASLQTDDLNNWKHFVLDQQNKADALLVVLYHTLKDKQGKHISPDTVLNWTVNNNHLPDFGFWSWAVSGGLLCSEAISGYQQGYYVGTIAAYVLRGQSTKEFAVGMPQRGEPCINMARARMLGIPVPPDMEKSATLFSVIESAK